MNPLPDDTGFDDTFALLGDPYRYILSRTRELGTNGFRTRFIGQKAVCLTGAEAARLVYDPTRFTREGAIPAIARDVLFGNGGVQTLNGPAHTHRKAMFLRIMGPETDLGAVEDLFAEEWRKAAADLRGEVDLLEVAKPVLTRVACRWADVPLQQDETGDMADMLSDLFLHAGPAPMGQIKGRTSRHKVEKAMQSMVEDVRSGKLAADPDRALSIIAHWTDRDGDPLPADIAAVEVVNVLRPTVAISVYLVFLAHALGRYGTAAARVPEDAAWRHAFVQEVRRTYPFFPATAAIAKQDIDWQGARIDEGTRVLLDIYGTNRDAAHWDDPDSFSPARFLGWTGDPFTLIPQGGGEHAVTHRCPGEWVTIRLMDRFATILTRDLDWQPTSPHVEPDYAALPALPKDGFRITVKQGNAA